MFPRLSRFLSQFRRQRWPVITASVGAWLVAGSLWAGDLLRGGAGGNVRPADSSVGAAVAAQQQARVSQQDALAKTAQALQAVRAMQDQARTLSARNGADHLGLDPNHPGQMLPSVPNGLGLGGLQLSGVPVGALRPVESRRGATAEVAIKQTQQQALLNWETFNVGRDTHLTFDQSDGGANVAQWIAFNRVTDPSGRPSQILGQISAPGQVYLINQNGILFGGASKINVGSLAASSLPINDNLIARGLLNNPDSQFLFSALPLPAGTKGTPAFVPAPSPLPDNRHGEVTVQSGALLSSPVSADGNGGRITLVGPKVTQGGSVLAPQGQVILAAGLQVGVAAHQSSDASLRGLDVYVGRVGSDGGTATNGGLIEVRRGSVSMSGKSVHQEGVIESSTAVSLNGRIDLAANYDAVPNPGFDAAVASTGNPFLFKSSGVVDLGPGSVMRILPEWSSAERAVGTELALRSQIHLQGKTVHFGGDARVLAPNALVSVQAGSWHVNEAITPPTSTFLAKGGQVYFEPGAGLDVSGSTGVVAPLSQVILSLVLRGGELAPAPLQRSGPLRGPTLTVDLRNQGVVNGRAWVGSPLADLTGYAALTERTVGELTAAGGSVDIAAGGSVVMQPGSGILVNGGHVEYLGGTVKTSRLWAEGHVVDIKDALPDRIYRGLYSGTWDEVHARWGVSHTYAQALALTGEHQEPTYLHGADAGTLTMAAPGMALDGQLGGRAAPGPRQMRLSSHSSDLPQAGRLTLSFSGQTMLNNAVVTDYPAPPNLIFDDRAQAASSGFSLDAVGAPAALDEARGGTVYLSPTLMGEPGWGSLTVHNEGGDITVPRHVALQSRPGGGFSFVGSNIQSFGSMIAPGGSLHFQALNLTPFDVASIRQRPEEQRWLPEPNPGRGVFTLGRGAALSTAGLVVDDRWHAADPFAVPASLAGGSIDIRGYSADLLEGSAIDVRGGSLITPLGARYDGDGGSIVLQGGQDPQLQGLVGGRFTLGSRLLGNSGAVGGSLAMQAPLIRVGGRTGPGELGLRPGFFSQGGFRQFSLTGLPARDALGGLPPAFVIAAGTRVQPVAQSLVSVPHPLGGGFDRIVVQKPVGVRPPVSLSFTAAGLRDGILDVPLLRGDLLMGEGAVIRTDPLAQVSFAGRTVSLLGETFAPGGSIAVTAGDSNAARPNSDVALTTLFLGPNALLSAAGTTLRLPDAYGRKLGSVLPGGRVSLTGNLLAAAGSLIDVSGAQGVIEVHPAVADPLRRYQLPVSSGLTEGLGRLAVVPVRVDSNGGVIAMTGIDFLLSGATLHGYAGGPKTLGGTLELASGRFYAPGNLPQPTDTNLSVWQNGSLLPGGVTGAVEAVGKPLPGKISGGFFGADSFTRGGFDALALGGSVRFQGPVVLEARGSLRVATEGILAADDVVRLSAPLVAVGRPLATPQRPEDRRSPFATSFAPSYGPGQLIVAAEHLDLGTLSLQNIGLASLSAVHGDIRGSGVVNVMGNLTLRAGQLYPVTASPFEIFVYDYPSGGGVQPGSVTMETSGRRDLPLSAGGSLGVYASRIQHDGVLRAPFGSIALGWDGTGTAPRDWLAGNSIAIPRTQEIILGDGSITSVAALDPGTGQGRLIPYGVSRDGLSWIDPRGVDITAGGLPEKSVSIAGQVVRLAAGATVDLRGGGDLFAYRWVEGNGGLVDIVASRNSYAIVPGYRGDIAPIASYNDSALATNLIGGFVSSYENERLGLGDRIFLQGSATLPAGNYTLLPAGYALLPGGVLVTPQAEQRTGVGELLDGASIVSGYQIAGTNGAGRGPTLASQFELARGSVIRQRAEYETYLGDAFLSDAAGRLNLPPPLLPKDSGRLLFQASQGLSLAGSVLSGSISGGRGSQVDISSTLPFIINRSGSGAPGSNALSSAVLQRWQAESLVIGGKRTTDADGRTMLHVASSGIEVDNAGAPLTAADLTLAATGGITLAPGAQLRSTGSVLADDYEVEGNGVLVRVSSAPDAAVIRRGAAPATSTVSLTIGAGAELIGGGIALDSTHAMALDPTAGLAARAYAINSGRISLVLGEADSPPASTGLVLTGSVLTKLQSGTTLALRSYSSIDLIGEGQIGGGLDRLVLHAGEIRGLHLTGEGFGFAAKEIQLGNPQGASSLGLGSLALSTARVRFNADVVRMTPGDVAWQGFGEVGFQAAQGVIGEGTGGMATAADMVIAAPLVTGAAGSHRSLTAGGNLTLQATGAASALAPGLGATLVLSSARTSLGSSVLLPSGSLTASSTGGPLLVQGRLDVAGQPQTFYDVTRYADGGTITLDSVTGDVVLGGGSLVRVAAGSGGGSAGSLSVIAPQGHFLDGGALAGAAGSGGTAGSFSLDTLALTTTAGLTSALSTAGFTQSQTFRIRRGDVFIDGMAVARQFALAADQGSITVAGTVDAAGPTGGMIQLAANQNVTLSESARLTVAGQRFDSAGKGGEITLEAGGQRLGVAGAGVLHLAAGSTLNLAVAEQTSTSAALGQFSGKLHLRAPQTAGGTDLGITAFQSTVLHPSSILVEGYKLYDLTASGGPITAAVQNQIRNDGLAFLGAPGVGNANESAITNRLLSSNAGLASALVLVPGAELINRAGTLTLGTASCTTLQDWDLSGYRFGAKGGAGFLTMRAAGDLIFNNSLSDGFTPFVPVNNPPATNLQLWQGRLMAPNPLLPGNAQSYSYRLTAGADLGGVFFAAVPSRSSAAGSLLLGKAGTSTDEQNNTVPGGDNALTRSVIPQRWQVIRTGSGDITVSAARNIQLLNHFAAIYSAGAAVADPTLGGTFEVPRPGQPPSGTSGLGAAQLTTLYPAQYAMGGGNVTLNAGGNIEHLTRNAAGQLVADSVWQLPNNWLYRRGTVDSATGQFAQGRSSNEVLSTSWWVDYSQFFQGVGALGGGQVSLAAGGNVSNVDAVAPTNFRVTKGNPSDPLAANQTAVEWGGGDVTVRAGNQIDGGIYYVERGVGTLYAGGSILTNATRSVLSPSSLAAGQGHAYTQLPTTLFAGRAHFEVSAKGSILLGPMANPFLLPEGLGNSIWYKSYFSTFAPQASLNVSALGGDVTFRTESTSAAGLAPLLFQWAVNKQMLGSDSAARGKPWLRLNESGLAELIRYRTMVSVQPGTLQAYASSGSIRLAGNLTLAPSPTGQLALLAAGAIDALQPTGLINDSGKGFTAWAASRINVSDADALDLANPWNPLGYTTAQAQAVATPQPLFFAGLDALFSETGSTTGVLQTKQALHAPGLLHRNDVAPLRLYAGAGDISGLTLFAPKASRIFAGGDLADVALYIQNIHDDDVSIIASGRDIIPANASAALRVAATRPGNVVTTEGGVAEAGPLAGDIQISGPGSLQVLAGRTLDLGTVAGRADGTGVGLTSVGNARNPYLRFTGAHLVAAAGLGASTGLGHSALDFDSFIDRYVTGGNGSQYLAELAPEMGGKSFDQWEGEEQKRLALEVFYRILRDAGRGHAGTATTTGGGYEDGFAAIGVLFPFTGAGDILTRGRDIRTRNGGNISLLAPGGGLALANTAIGNPLAPPGIVTESGGNISIFTDGDVSVGIGRIFTLRGGNQIIWSSRGNIAAGRSSKTVKNAPPTRVLMDPQSAAVQTDLAGLATGGGIGVLATVAGVDPGNVDLIAPVGVVDAGDAGIRSSGNLSIAASQVLNAGNIAVSGSSAGTPTPVVSTPNVVGLTAAGTTAAAGNAAAAAVQSARPSPQPAPPQALPSLISVIVEGYGGGEGEGEGSDAETDEERRKRAGAAVSQ